MLKILNTYAGCNARSKMTVVCGENIYYASCSNIIKVAKKVVTEVIFLDGIINCLSSKDDILVVGDIDGNGYVIENDLVIYKTKFDGSIQECQIKEKDNIIFCTIDNIFIENYLTGCRIKHQLGYLVNCCIPFSYLTNHVLAVGDSIGTLHVYTIKNNSLELIEAIAAHMDGIKDIKIGGSGLIATCSQDYNVKIWEFNCRFQLLQTLNGHNDWINSICWDNEILLSASSDKTIRVWEDEHKIENTHAFSNTEIFGGSSAFLSTGVLNGMVFAQYKTGGIDGFDLKGDFDDEYIFSGHQDEITDLDWRGDLLLSTSLDCTARLFYKNKECGRPQIHGYPLTSARFLCGNKLRFISSAEETILRVFECTQRFLLNYEEAKNQCDNESYDFCDLVDDATTFPNTETVMDEYVEDAILAELNLTNHIVHELTHSPLTENTLAANVFNETQKIYGHFFDVKNVAVNKNLIFSCNKSSSKAFAGLFVWNLKGEKIGYYADHDLGIQKIKATESYVLTVSRDKTACLYTINGEILHLVKRFYDHSRAIWDGSISWDNQFFTTCSRDCKVIFYSLKSLEPCVSKVFECEVTAVEFSKTEKLIFIGLQNGMVEVLDFDLNVKYKKRVLGKRVNVIRSNGNGYKIAIGGSDGLIRIMGMY